jgi:lipoate-protein ligase B
VIAFSRHKKLEVIDLGRTDHASAERVMMELVNAIADGEKPDHLLFCELDSVLTVGRATPKDAVLDPALPVRQVSRGGKATYHGPGQLVVYPLILLQEGRRDLHAYLHALEEALIQTVGEFGLKGVRDPRNTGCWVDGKKIASIGVAVRRWVTYHGLALNVFTDLRHFQNFDPCGLEASLLTSLKNQLEFPPSIAQTQSQLQHKLNELLCS